MWRGDGGFDLTESVADSDDSFDSGECAEEPDGEGHEDNSCQGSGDSLGDHRGEDDDEEGGEGYEGCGEVDCREITDVDAPFAEEIGGDFFGDGKAEEIRDLCGEDGEGDTGRESYDNRVGDELDDCAEAEDTH